MTKEELKWANSVKEKAIRKSLEELLLAKMEGRLCIIAPPPTKEQLERIASFQKHSICPEITIEQAGAMMELARLDQEMGRYDETENPLRKE